MENYIKLMRPKHWVKNLLIFLPSALASEFDKLISINCILAFFSMSFIASAVYILNDIKDVQKDISETLRLIQEEESNYSDLHKTDYVTKKKPSREMRKLKKNNKNGGPLDLKPTTKSRRTAKSNKQTELIGLYERYDELQGLEKELIEDRLPLLEEYAAKKKLLDHYKSRMGENWISYTEKDGLYTYADILV